MKLWLDDVRTPPDESWHWVRTAPCAIRALAHGEWAAVSLDHDLGPDDAGTGYDVLRWIEQQVVEFEWPPPAVLLVHSANPVGRDRMVAGIDSIRRLWADRLAYRRAPHLVRPPQPRST